MSDTEDADWWAVVDALWNYWDNSTGRKVNMETVSIWTLLEQPAPKGCEAIQDLYSWSLNYDHGKGPYALFLDLIGWSEDNYGESVYDYANRNLGYLELHKLAEALTAYANTPHDVHLYVDQLMAAEDS